MPHMRHPQKAMVRKIAWVSHAKPNTQGHARILFAPTAQIRGMGRAKTRRRH